MHTSWSHASAEDVDRVKKEGTVVHSPLFSLAFLPVSGESARGSCVVSKKIAGTATGRNRIKRRCTEAMRTWQKEHPTPHVMIMRAKKAITDASFHDVQREIARCMRT